MKGIAKAEGVDEFGNVDKVIQAVIDRDREFWSESPDSVQCAPQRIGFGTFNIHLFKVYLRNGAPRNEIVDRERHYFAIEFLFPIHRHFAARAIVDEIHGLARSFPHRVFYYRDPLLQFRIQGQVLAQDVKVAGNEFIGKDFPLLSYLPGKIEGGISPTS